MRVTAMGKGHQQAYNRHRSRQGRASEQRGILSCGGNVKSEPTSPLEEQEARPEEVAVHREPPASLARSLSVPGPLPATLTRGKGVLLRAGTKEEKGRAGLGAVHSCGWAWQEERQPDPLQFYSATVHFRFPAAPLGGGFFLLSGAN